MTTLASACPFCGMQALQAQHTGARDYITGHEFSVLICPACGGGHTAPIPADFSLYYPALYRRYRKSIAAIIGMFYSQRVARWLKDHPQPGSAFELGCGDGSMLAILRNHGWRVLGCERSQAAAQLARDVSGIDVLAGELDAVPADAVFDLILLIQALEHMKNPAEILTRLAGMLAPGGKLIIAVPNFGSWQARFGGKAWFHLDVPRHVSHFTIKALAALTASTGLEVQRISFESFEHDPYGWIQSTLNLLDPQPNRLTRLLMRLDSPDIMNLLHLFAACLLGPIAILAAMFSCAARRGAIIEVTCALRATVQPATS
ncbi:MAG: methyltransferase domain-containing protein [Rhodospirillales bacterium]|nr:methyltransferase domain-containing protein [Rhodospirillales bacterium]MDE2318514.1 class I SAM-dependent methyltransferase [Rhodospirillales bacterium]